MKSAPPPLETAVLLYDGDCGVCARSVQFVLRRESTAQRRRLRFAPLQGRFAESIASLVPDVTQRGSVLWVEPTPEGSWRVLRRSDAALAALRHLGGAWRLLGTVSRWLPRALRDSVYGWVAQRRLTLAPPACLLPTPDDRPRFLP